MTEKLCVFCKHFDYESIYKGADYSDVTVGDMEGGMCCNKKYYFWNRPYDVQSFREIILRASDCKDYEPAK